MATKRFAIDVVPFVSRTDTDALVPIHIRAYGGDECEKLQFPNGPEPAFVRSLYEEVMIKDESCIAVVARSADDTEIGDTKVSKDTILGFAVWIDRSMVPAKPPSEEDMSRAPEV